MVGSSGRGQLPYYSLVVGQVVSYMTALLLLSGRSSGQYMSFSSLAALFLLNGRSSGRSCACINEEMVLGAK